MIDGLSKKEAPGSLWSPSPTSLGIDNWKNVGQAFGLFMAGVRLYSRFQPVLVFSDDWVL